MESKIREDDDMRFVEEKRALLLDGRLRALIYIHTKFQSRTKHIFTCFAVASSLIRAQTSRTKKAIL